MDTGNCGQQFNSLYQQLNPRRAERLPEKRIADVREAAIDNGVVIRGSENSLYALHPDTRSKAAQVLHQLLDEVRPEDILRESPSVQRLSEFLTTEALRDWLGSVSKSLLLRASFPPLREIRTEVLLSLSSDLYSSSSSSVQDGESVGEVATPSRAETVVPDGGSVTAMGAHTRMDGGAV